AMGLVLEATVAMAVARDVISLVSDRLGGGGPQVTGGFIANVQRFARRVADRIVRPGRELVLPAVLGPGVAAALRRHLETERRVGDHIDPGGRRGGALLQYDDVFAPVLGEAAQAVEEFQVLWWFDVLGQCRGVGPTRDARR